MNRVRVLGVGLLLFSAVARGQYLPLERPEGAVEATDQTGARPIGYQFGNPINRIVVFNPAAKPQQGVSPLEVDREFKARNITTAVNWSSDALKALDGADVTALTQTCTACHNAHRVRQDDGTYRLKTGGR